MNVTGAETRFELETSRSEPLLREMFISCSADRDNGYTLTINLELDNPFKEVSIHYDKATNLPGLSLGNQLQSNGTVNQKAQQPTHGLFQILLPNSSFLVQLSQKIDYDGFLVVKYVQLAPNVSYDFLCDKCSDNDREYLEKIFGKRMSPFDAELDAILSEKLLLGLQILLSQQRLDLDLNS